MNGAKSHLCAHSHSVSLAFVLIVCVAVPAPSQEVLGRAVEISVAEVRPRGGFREPRGDPAPVPADGDAPKGGFSGLRDARGGAGGGGEFSSFKRRGDKEGGKREGEDPGAKREGWTSRRPLNKDAPVFGAPKAAPVRASHSLRCLCVSVPVSLVVGLVLSWLSAVSASPHSCVGLCARSCGMCVRACVAVCARVCVFLCVSVWGSFELPRVPPT